MKILPAVLSIALFASISSLGGCSRSVKAEDADYAAAFRKSTEEQTKDATDFDHTAWTATQELRSDGKVKPETLKSLKDIVDRKRSHFEAFSAVKAPQIFAEFHAITTEFMKKKLDIDADQVNLFENGQERQLSRITDKIEVIGLDYQKKLKSYMEKIDKGYFDQAMKSNDEFR